jgi:hypothetical protein
MVDPVHVAHGVHAVTQSDVLDVELVAGFDVESAVHWAIPPCFMRRAAISSPVAFAAAVMMSRLPE